MKRIPVYVITTPKGKTLVRTRLVGPRWYTEHGYTVTRASIAPKAARAIARIVAGDCPEGG